MLKKLFNSLIQHVKKTESSVEQNIKLDEAGKLMESGDMHGAVIAYRAYLKLDPYHVGALNNLGVCLMDIGSNEEARATFDLAFSLDDTYVPGIVNQARLYIEQNRSVEALPFLKQAKACSPEFTHVDAVYASYCLRMGQTAAACHFQKKAWLANFEKTRYANCHLFYSSYDDIDDMVVAAEHKFWGETVHPLQLELDRATNLPALGTPEESGRKIRLGYWSPDMRNHSVRYFFRPLLENHDKSRFEIYLYNDGPLADEQTALMEAAGSQYHQCYELSDVEICNLMHSHQLDVLVELAGHSSYNRITLLQERFATLQVTGLGYPPTIGLASIDAKILDCHVVNAGSTSFYTEYPLALPTSFWCFDPMEEVPINVEPPVIRNGFITFACIGNLAKINDRMLRCWKTILDQVPNGRLLIRSINFDDQNAENTMRQTLIDAGIDIGRVDLRKPAGGAAFFSSYSEIDIVLDTFPFNGGTTTCFATYMGVPVVSLSGQSLNSRMGHSILSNLGLSDLSVTSESDYVSRAVAIANDSAFLAKFRGEARGLFQNSSLGNGKLFARDFEEACISLLEQKRNHSFAHQSTVPALPVEELVRRGYTVLGLDQADAAKRILKHCLQHYPENGSVQLFAAQLTIGDRDFAAGLTYLSPIVEQLAPAEQVGALITLTRWSLLEGQQTMARQWVERLQALPIDDDFDQMQTRLYQACVAVLETKAPSTPTPLAWVAPASGKSFHILIPCDSESHFEAMRTQMASICGLPEGWQVTYQRCKESARCDAYRAALDQGHADVLILMHKNVSIHAPEFFQETVAALECSDLVGFAGASRWNRVDWRSDEFSVKAAGFITPSSEVNGFCEIQWLGGSASPMVEGLAVLDGHLLAVRPSRLKEIEFDEEILEAERLMEEDWTHAAFQAGLRLGVHRGLGVLLMQQHERSDTRQRTPALMRLVEKHGFDPFAIEKKDTMYLSCPVETVYHALQAINVFMKTGT